MKQFFKTYREVILGMLIRPMSTIRFCIDRFTFRSICYTALLMSTFQGLLSIINLKIITDKGVFENFEAFSFGGYKLYTQNYTSIFWFSALFYLITIIVLTASIDFLGNKVFKAKVDFATTLKIVVISTMPYVIALFFNNLLSIITPVLGVAIILMGLITMFLCNFNAVKETFDLSNDTSVYMISFSYAMLWFINYLLIILVW